jgi:hypothetical protein
MQRWRTSARGFRRATSPESQDRPTPRSNLRVSGSCGAVGIRPFDPVRTTTAGSPASLKRTPNQRDLERDANPVGDLGAEAAVSSSIYGHLHVRGPDEDKKDRRTDTRPPVTPPQTRGKDKFCRPADVDELGLGGQEARDDAREGRWPREVDDAAHAEGGSHDPGAACVPCSAVARSRNCRVHGRTL